jgi:GTPase SAR1 family protein
VTSSADSLKTSLEALAAELDAFRFRLPGHRAVKGDLERDELVTSIRQYLVPRLRDPDAPVVAVIVGPTGSGKSVLLNSLAGEAVTEVGPLRPTTRSPVVWTHRKHERRYEKGFLPELSAGNELSIAAGSDILTEQLTLVDAPDFESVYSDSRRMAEDVLAVADLCIFVASAMRYADAAAWDFLGQVRKRGLPILFVMNRLPADPQTRLTLLDDFATLLKDNDLLLEADRDLIFEITEQVVYPKHSGLPAEAVAAIRSELGLISDPALRAEVVRQSTEGAMAELIERTRAIAGEVDAETRSIAKLARGASEAYATERARAMQDLQQGSIVQLSSGQSQPYLVDELASALTRRAGNAARAAAVRWAEDDFGRGLLEIADGLWRHGSDVPEAAGEAAAEWGQRISELAVARARRGRRRRELTEGLTARVLTGADLAPQVLERLGDENIPALLQMAAQSLEISITRVMDIDQARFVSVLRRLELPEGLAERLRAHSDRVSADAGTYYR